MTIRVMPKEFCNALTCYRSLKDPALHRAVTKRPLVAAKGGPQFTRFRKILIVE